MDKQKQIEEMAKDMLNYAMEYYPKDSVFSQTKLREHFYHLYLGYAQYLIKAGYRKIPEGAVIVEPSNAGARVMKFPKYK